MLKFQEIGRNYCCSRRVQNEYSSLFCIRVDTKLSVSQIHLNYQPLGSWAALPTYGLKHDLLTLLELLLIG